MNRIIKRRVLGLSLLTVLLIGSFECYSATPETTPDSLVYSLHFRQGAYLLLKDYRNNEQTLQAMEEAFTPDNVSRIFKIKITGSASPEGTVERNTQLSLKRAEALRRYILWRWKDVDRNTTEVVKQTDYLSAWLRAVVQANDMPKQMEVIKILHSNASIPTKWANIQRVSADAARYMELRIFPYLRSAMTVVVYQSPKPTNSQALDEPTDRQTDIETTADTITIKNGTPDAIQSVVEPPVSIVGAISTPEKTTDDTTAASKQADANNQANEPAEHKQADANNQAIETESKATTTIAETDEIGSVIPNKETRYKENYRFAIKTNLLQSAVAFAPNLGFEYALNHKTTIELTGALNHWGLNGSATNNKKLAHWIVQSEYRYWLKNSFDGHFFGVHALGGKYNISGHNLPNLFLGGKLMDSQYRYFGWTIGAGVSYGYHLRFARHWGVEFNIGIGVAHLRYDKYDCVRCGRKLSTETKTYFGPTKAGISLMYNF